MTGLIKAKRFLLFPPLFFFFFCFLHNLTKMYLARIKEIGPKLKLL